MLFYCKGEDEPHESGERGGSEERKVKLRGERRRHPWEWEPHGHHVHNFANVDIVPETYE